VVGGVPIALILHPQNRCFKYYLVLWKTVRYPHFVVFILFALTIVSCKKNSYKTLKAPYIWATFDSTQIQTFLPSIRLAAVSNRSDAIVPQTSVQVFGMIKRYQRVCWRYVQ
jgi:hypothetical protein